MSIPQKCFQNAAQHKPRNFKFNIDSQVAKVSKEGINFLTNNIDEVFWVFNLDTLKLEYISPNIFQIRGYTPEEMLAKPFLENYAQSAQQAIFNVLLEKLNQNAKHINNETINLGTFEQYHKDGSSRFLELTVSVNYDATSDSLYLFGLSKNITDLKREIEKRIEEQTKNQLLSNLTIEAIFLHQNSNVIQINSQFEKLFGYTIDEIKKANLLELLVHENYHSLTISKMEHKDTKPYEIVCKKADGTNFFAEVEARNVMLDGQEVRLTAVRDIDERKKLELERQIERQILEEAQVMSNIGSWTYNLDENSYRFSNQLFKIFDIPPKEFFTVDELVERVHPDDLPHFNCEFQNAYQGKEVSFEHRLLCGPNKECIKWVQAKTKAFKSKNGELISFTGVVRDITEEREKEDKLKAAINSLSESRARYKVLFDASPIMLHYLSDEGIILKANKKWTEEMGYEAEEIIGKYALDFLTEKSRKRVLANLDKYLKGGATKAEQYQMVKKDGSVIDVLISKQKAFDTKMSGATAFVLNITKYNKAQEKLQKSKEYLKELNQTKDKFFNIIAHDLKNPIYNITNLTHLLHEIKENLTKDELSNISKMLKDSANQTAELLENLLEWSRIQEGTLKVEPINLNLNKIIDKNIQLAALTASNKKIDLVFDETIENYKLWADEKMVDTIFRNLISNAIKFTPGGGSVKVGFSFDKDITTCYVKDTGVGISPEQLQKLFKPGESVSTKGTNKEKGSGLGLILVNEFIKQHNGDIWVKSEIGKGSTFYFTLLLKK